MDQVHAQRLRATLAAIEEDQAPGGEHRWDQSDWARCFAAFAYALRVQGRVGHALPLLSSPTAVWLGLDPEQHNGGSGLFAHQATLDDLRDEVARLTAGAE